jgi:hypothetical protein
MATRTTLSAVLAALAFCLSASPVCAAKKAFVVGIDQYQHLDQLTHSINDANDVAQQLRAFGYDSVVLTNAADVTRTGFLLAWQKLLNGLKEGDDVVFFYSGHGVEVQGTNYLVPIDTPSADDLGGSDILKQVLISLPDLLDALNKKSLNGIVWILDACRNNPFNTGGKSLGGPVGLAGMPGPAGTFILYSAGVGQTALDHLPSDPPSERNSVYTRVLLQMLPTYQQAPVWDLAHDIKPKVLQLAKPHDQLPAYYDQLESAWCFVTCRVQPLQTSFQTTSIKIDKPSTPQIVTALQDENLAAVLDRKEPNAVFLGRKSAAETCADSSGVNFPFGCFLLRALLPRQSAEATEASRKKLIDVPITPQTPVNVRLHLPTVDERGEGNYTCVVQTLTPKSTIKLSGIFEIGYADDTFYWGTVAGEAKDCRDR